MCLSVALTACIHSLSNKLALNHNANYIITLGPCHTGMTHRNCAIQVAQRNLCYALFARIQHINNIIVQSGRDKLAIAQYGLRNPYQ